MRLFWILLSLLLCIFAQSQTPQEIYKGMQSKDKAARIEAIRLGLLRLDDPVLQQYALETATSLPFQDQQRLVPLLMEIHDKTKEDVREHLLYMLAMVAPKSGKVLEILTNAIEKGSNNEKQYILLGLALARKEALFALPSLIKIYPKSDNDIRALILDRLATIGSTVPGTLEILKNALKDKSPILMSKAAFALGEIGEKDSTVLALLKERLQEPNATVLASCAEALGKLLQTDQESLSRTQEEIAQILWKLKDHEDIQVRISSMLSLAQISRKRKENAMQALSKDLSQEDSLLCLQAARAVLLIDKKNKAAIRVFIKIAKSDSYSQALSFMGKLALDDEEIVQFLQSQATKQEIPINQRLQALFALHSISKDTGNKQTSFFQTLQKEESNPKIREFLEKALKK
ncbi:MAG: HEAT repeat domain-containing protein [Candidatus Brocadiae bacterium]|nr:HEAT repeat domain-containing protein [Candidatus Brocadiia bacterium]